MEEYGLIGYPLGHSFSKRYFSEKFRKEGTGSSYELFPLSAITELDSLLSAHPSLKGFNVTIPYKERIMPFLAMLSPEAEAIGAVNVVRIDNGVLSGHNTDCLGFRDALRPMLRPDVTRALVLGSGGASKAVCHALRQLGIEPEVVSRNPREGQVSYHDLPELIAPCPLIVNTTPLGMFPDTDTAPDIPYRLLTPAHICFDLVYNPEETLFMRLAARQGATVSNGLEMLYRQAEYAWQIWKR